MKLTLSATECRIIGVLLEKEITTPEQYPLSLNGLTTGCNQKSNREPVMQLSETQVQNALDELAAKRQIMEDQYGSRVAKYKHKFCNTEFGSFKFSPQQTAIVCLLLLRGPQTPGELRTRSGRLAEFTNVTEVEKALEQLADFNSDTLVIRLPREPGKRESRYMHCFGESPPEASVQTFTGTPPSVGESNNTLHDVNNDLEARVAVLEEQVAELTQKLSDALGDEA